MLHLSCCAGDSGLDVFGVIGDGEGLMIPGPGLDDAAYVLQTGLAVVSVGEEDVDAGEMAVESVEKMVKFGLDRGGESGVHGDVLVAVDQDLHGDLFQGA